MPVSTRDKNSSKENWKGTLGRELADFRVSGNLSKIKLGGRSKRTLGISLLRVQEMWKDSCVGVGSHKKACGLQNKTHTHPMIFSICT